MDEREHYVRQGKLFDKYSLKDELKVELDTLPEEVRINREAATHE